MIPNAHLSVFPKKHRTALVLVTLLTLFALLLAACGGESATKSGNNGKSVLTIGAQSSDFIQAGFNPYNPHPNIGVFGLVYETLYFTNRITGEYTPWLASSYQWNSDNTQLTFTLRPNVKWNDGQAFTADDVVYTFNTINQYKSADLQGVWSYLKSVASSDPKTVTMTFTQAYPPSFYNIVSTYIVPKHIFGSQGDPTKFTPDKPVGTGPFTLKKSEAALAVYDKNPNYWQADKVKVSEVRFPVYKDNDTFKLALPKGQIDWAGYFQADLKTAFVDKDPAHNHYWMAPINIFTLSVNQKNPLLSQVAVRQAINAALDRNALSTQGESGLAGPANATGLILPNNQKYLDPAYANLPNTPDKAKAEKFLTDAGFTKGSDGIYQKDGQRLSFKLRTVQSYSDWAVMAQIIQGNLKDVGIEINLDQISEDAYYPSRTDGKFDLMISGMVGGPNPYYMYNQYLNSANIGVTNFSQWKDDKTDQLLKQFASTTDENAQKQALLGLQKIYVEQLPTIPLVTGPDWSEYRTTNFTGWPTESNPYASPSPNEGSDMAVVIMHLQPVQ